VDHSSLCGRAFLTPSVKIQQSLPINVKVHKSVDIAQDVSEVVKYRGTVTSASELYVLPHTLLDVGFYLDITKAHRPSACSL